ncbi:hypothetical protein B566_EDAN004714 [Ephemera danica]|nr:hypothetical protein B566_EDAN004714 [Ephemera danica]
MQVEKNFVFFGLAVHVIFLLSIFDVYFNSPVIQGIEAYHPTFEPLANRLVLFVADGLRASSFFHNHLEAAPYLREIIETRGSWGVSHTRVPTESRPGHVALIAGLYEDPSAVTKGWKENPVQFDSVFNRSSHTWAWGSPDILPMFAKGEAAGKVTTHCYPASMQRFSGDGSNEKLDLWVLERTLKFFGSSQDVHEFGDIFFLHFLGIDTAGHATKPHSRQYIDNINLVDDAIKQVEKAVNKFYGNDNKTAFIFTSDHGMTDWGSHGAGLPDETETPLVVWGAGLRGPSLAQTDESAEWGLSHLQRNDVKQADIAALMSALLAIPTPTNNVGLVPHKLLSADHSWVAKALLSNANQLLLQLQRAKELVQEHLLPIFWLPWPVVINVKHAETLIEQGQFDEAIVYIRELKDITLEGIQYYQEYFGRNLKWFITAAHILWLLCLVKSTIPQKPAKIQRLPLQFMVYYSLPIFLSWLLLRDVAVWFPTIKALFQENAMYILIMLSLILFGVTLLVLSFYQRSSLSFGLCLLALWPVIEKCYGKQIDFRLIILWAISCLLLSIFPLMPVVGRGVNYTLLLSSGLLTNVVGLVGIWILSKYKSILSSRRDLFLLVMQCFVVSITSVNVFITARHFEAVSSFVIPGFTGARDLRLRVSSVWLSLTCVLLLLSVSHEALFLLALLVTMSVYPAIEVQLEAAKTKLFFSVLAFFGLGNVASLNSFDPTWVRCLVTTFSPYLMGMLILLKTIVPFLAVACGVYVTSQLTQSKNVEI